MKKKPLNPFVPVERRETIRQKIVSLLEGNTLSARDISVEAGISEKEAYEHLEHIERTISKGNHTFTVTPAACKKCGFVFRKRERLKKPGKCPACRSESIEDPLFSIESK
jgi:predicted Zn-ribbon and HTH transcriptional regulator